MFFVRRVGNGRVSDTTAQEFLESQEERTLQVEHRDPLALSLQALEEAGLVTNEQPVRQHQGKIIRIQSRLAVGVDQRICLSWSIPHRYYFDGYRLMAYRRNNGFAPEADVTKLESHGVKIIDDRRNNTKEEILPEGEYFYTFLLHKKAWFGCLALTADVVQFSERVPGAKYAIERLEDTYKARRLIGKILQQSNDLKRLVGDRDVQGGRLSGQSMAQFLAAQQAEIDDLKQSPEWKKCRKHEKEFIIATIRKKYRKMMGGD